MKLYIFSLHRLTQRLTKGSGGSYRLVYDVEESDDRFFLPGGLMFLKATQGMVKHPLRPSICSNPKLTSEII
jgi:hypothetical protein